MRYSSIGVAALLCLLPVSSMAADLLPIEQAVQQAVKENPGLTAQGKRADALQEVAPQVASLPDPKLSLGALNFPTNTFSNTQENMTQWQLGVSQAIPFPGKLSLRASIAEQLAEAARLDQDEFRLQLVFQVRQHWWNIFYLDRALETVSKNQQLLRQLIRIAETKYKVGHGLQQDVLLAQLELSKLLDVAIQLKAARREQEARLNALMNRQNTAPLRLPEHVSERLATLPNHETLLELAWKQRPFLKQKQVYIEAAQHKVELAEKDNQPDFNIGAAYGVRSGSNPASGAARANLASIQLSMTLPWFTQDKQDHQTAQRQAELAQAEFAYDDARNAVASSIAQVRAVYEKNQSQSELFRQAIIPQAKQTVASMQAAYQVNKVDFLNLVRAQITLYNYETQYWKSLTQAKQAWAKMSRMVGQELTNE